MRCEWCLSNDLLQKYHDEEWGTPVHDDQLLFEHLILDCFQAGLSWQTILNKRENFRIAFDNFNIEKVAGYSPDKINQLLKNAGIIRNRMKIEAAINNAQKVKEVQKEYGSFDSFIWKFTKHKTQRNSFKTMQDIPASSVESDEMSKELKKLGFKFVGTTICYAFMQAVGIVNDHKTDCFRYQQLIQA